MACKRDNIRTWEFERSQLVNNNLEMTKYTEISDHNSKSYYTVIDYRTDKIIDELSITKNGKTIIYANELTDTLPETNFRKVWFDDKTKLISNDSIDKLVNEIKKTYKLN